MTTTKKPAKKTGEALRKDAIASVEANLARLDAPRNAAPDAAGSAKPARKAKGGGKPAHGPTSAATAGAKAGGKGKPKAAKAGKTKKMSGLDAAAKILADSGKAMNCADIVEAARSKGLWSSSGKTPAATIYAAIIREIAAKKKDARFKKTERGMFTAAKGA